MKIDLLDQKKLIQVNNLKEITSPMLYANKKMIFDSQGILSNEIFGLSKGDRRSTFAYVDLKRHFLHPHIYSNILKRTHRNIMYIVSGQRRYKVVNGSLIQAPDGWTGLEQLYNHWDEINWAKAKVADTLPPDEEDTPNPTTAKQLLSNLSREEAFIDTLIISPPAYRDVMLSGTIDSSDHTNPVNEMYQQVIRMVSMLQEGGQFARTQYATQMKVQDKLVEIFNHYKDLIRAKNGLIRKNLMGKSVDFGTRAVISAPTYRHNRFEDNIVDLEHSALPISMCCSSFKPLIESWLKNFFTAEVINAPSNLISYRDPKTNKDITGSIKDADVQFSERNITRLVNDYMLNPDHRFTPIRITIVAPTPSGEKTINAVLMLKGTILLPNNAQQLLHRPMTLTDILYLASVDVCEKRHIMVSRYPVGTDKGIYFANARVQSTQDHIRLLYNGKEYPFYPDINLQTPTSQVGIQFIDTLVMSNAHLDGMGEQVCAHVKLLELLERLYRMDRLCPCRNTCAS